MTETPIELDKHRGMAAQKATDIRRVIAEVEANAKLLRDKQGVVEIEIPRRAGHLVARGGRRGVRIVSLSGYNKRSAGLGASAATVARR